MTITVIHGQAHKGVTYMMTHEVLKNLVTNSDQIFEFFLPKDGPGFCVGCYSCFLKGEKYCPSADKVQPIAEAIEKADVIMLDSPNYVFEMSGAMKNLMDHLAYRWISHRPSGTMFKKVGVALSSSAGAPARRITKSMARQLKWMCVPKVYLFPFISNAMGINDLKLEKRLKLERKAKKIAGKVKKRACHPHASFKNKLLFRIFRKMQSSPKAVWNSTDRDWWVNQGWTAEIRPWKKII
jgi:multimeric flavodoxin WrbA